jgi:hypothetical protein
MQANMPSLFSKRTQHPLFVLLALFLFSLPAYGWLLLRPGIFGDDPQLLYAFHRYGLSGYADALGWSRPFGIWVYALLLPLSGENLLVWQLSAVLLRVSSAWLLYLLLRETDETWQMTGALAAFACLLYPGFSQQAHALQFLLHWSALSACLGSQWLMLRALQVKDKYKSLALNILSLLLAALGIFSTEYFIGVEMLRPFLLWYHLKTQAGQKRPLKSTIVRWLPYLGLLLAFLIWRLFLADIPYPQPLLLVEIGQNPNSAAGYLLARIPSDLWQSGVLAWVRIFNPVLFEGWFKIGMGLLSAVVFCFLFRNCIQEKAGERLRISLLFIALGLLSMLTGGLPLWVSRTPLEISFPANRTTLCLLAGSCLMLAGLLRLLPARIGLVAASLLIGSSVVFQFNVSQDYSKAWDKLSDFFQQLTRCAPGLEPGTLILYDNLPIRYFPANSYAALLNWSYDPHAETGRKAYDVFQISERLGNALPALEKGLPVRHGNFLGSTSKALVIALDENGCLRFLGKEDAVSAEFSPLLRQAALLSNFEMINVDPINIAVPPTFMQPILHTSSCRCNGY